VNSITTATKHSPPICCADDSCPTMQGENWEGVRTKAEEEATKVSNWLSSRGMAVNENKSEWDVLQQRQNSQSNYQSSCKHNLKCEIYNNAGSYS